MLLQWFEARDAKNWVLADSIRERLRAQGVEPSECQRPDRDWSGTPYDKAVSAKGVGTPRSAAKDSGQAGAVGGPVSAAVDFVLLQWFQARDAKNWFVADSIRDRLRAQGVEPSKCQRPDRDWSGSPYGKAGGISVARAKPYTSGGAAGALGGSSNDFELLQWFKAKDARNFVVADSIRDRLRARGVSPSKCKRPAAQSVTMQGSFAGTAYDHAGEALRALMGSAPRAAAGNFDLATEAQLDLWWKHKLDKNFGLADKVRAELRVKGIQPDQHRPK